MKKRFRREVLSEERRVCAAACKIVFVCFLCCGFLCVLVWWLRNFRSSGYRVRIVPARGKHACTSRLHTKRNFSWLFPRRRFFVQPPSASVYHFWQVNTKLKFLVILLIFVQSALCSCCCCWKIQGIFCSVCLRCSTECGTPPLVTVCIVFKFAMLVVGF